MSEIRTDRHPATPAQVGVWIAQQLEPDSSRFLCAGYLDLVGDLDVEVLGRAVERTVRETETLRVRLVEEDGQLWQEPVTGAPRPLAIADVAGHPDPAAEARRRMDHDLTSGADLGGPHPPHRHIAYRLASNRHLLYFRYHHLVLDGFGQALHFRRLATVYSALAAGGEPPAVRHVPLADLAAEESTFEDTPRGHRAAAY